MKRGIIAGVAGAIALATAALFGPNAIADWHRGDDDEPQSVLDGLDAATIDIGRTEAVDLALSVPDTATGRVRQVLHHPEAAYVAVHFADLSVPPGGQVTVSNPDGTETYRVDDSADGRWATSITGDTAIVELRAPADTSNTDPGLSAVIDQVAYGFSPAELAERRRDEPVEESQCGGDDKRRAVCYESSHPVEYANTDPVARVLIGGTTLCTAFRVGDGNTLLTNNHCFDNDWQARDAELWFGYQCQSCRSDAATTPVKVHGQQVLSTDRNLDYTLFSVDDFGAIESFGSLTLADRTARPGEELYIPQHPGGRPAELAMDSDSDSGNCQVHRPRYDGYSPGSDVAYYCDTEFGSSGSPVLSRDTHEVIALHHFGGCPNSGVRSDLLLRRVGKLL